MLYGNTYIRFDNKSNKEYIYLKNYCNDDSGIYNNTMGKTFIDFLSNSDEILEFLKNESLPFSKTKKIKDVDYVHTISQNKLENLNPIFKYFNYDNYISNYIENLRDKNNIKIQNYLKSLKTLQEQLEYYNSTEYYEETLQEHLSCYHDYNSSKFKKAFYYINKSEKNINESLKRYEFKYGHKLKLNNYDSLYKKNNNYIKGNNIICEFNEEIYNKYSENIKKSITNNIKHSIKQTKKNIKFYKSIIKQYVKENEKTLEEVFNESLENLTFWINFSKYIIIYFNNLSEEKYNNFSSNQRLLDYLLHITGTYYNENIFEVPQSNITLNLTNKNLTSDLYEFIKTHRKELLSKNNILLKELNTYTVDLIQEYSINSIEDFIHVSLMQILQNNIKICKCENCNKLFISINKSNEKYCTYEFKNNKTCRDLSYSIHLQNDELANILRKNYRTENARKNRNSHIPNIQTKFDNWYSKAKEKKKLCEKGIISHKDFITWFIDNKNWF